MIHLSVSQPFENYKRGDLITDPVKIAAARAEYPHSVVQAIQHDSHRSGDFWRTDAEIKARAAAGTQSERVVSEIASLDAQIKKIEGK